MTDAVDPTRTAIVLVDLQNAFCHPEGSVGRQGRDVTAMAEAATVAIGVARAVRAAGGTVVWTRYELRPDYRDAGSTLRRTRPAMQEHGALHAGSWDARLWREEEVATEDLVVPKSRMSALLGTPLELLLKDVGTTSVLVAGLTTSMCVETTVRDLAQRDHDVHVVTDAVADFDPARHEASLTAMRFGFARTLEAAQIPGLLGAGTPA